LSLPALKSVTFLQIHATELQLLDMLNCQLFRLENLELETPSLLTWKSEATYPQLALLDLEAPTLHVFPIVHMPKITEFSFSCSFIELPKNLCLYSKLNTIAFENLCPVKVDKCLISMIEKGVYSNLTVYDKPDGKILMDVNSLDK